MSIQNLCSLKNVQIGNWGISVAIAVKGVA